MKLSRTSLGIYLTFIGVLLLTIGGIWFFSQDKPVSALESALASPSSNSSSTLSSTQEESSQKPSSTESVPDSSAEEPSSAVPEEASSKVSSGEAKKIPSSSPAVSSAPPSSAPTVPVTRPSSDGKYIVGYYPSWAASSELPPAGVSASLLTHINYAFANVDAQGRLVLANPQTDTKNFEGLRALKKSYPHLKTLISAGGWDYSKNFSYAASTAQTRQAFAQSCIDFVVQYGFDGVDIDWEFPGSKDKQNFTLMLRELRTALDRQSAQDGKAYYLTIAGAPGQSFLQNMEAQAVASLVDYIFLMGYDMHGPWDSFADLNAPLYTPQESSPHYKLSVSDAVWAYQKAGVPSAKLVLGMPFYGYQYTTNRDTSNGLYSSFSSAKSIGYDKLAANFLGNAQFTSYFHETARTPWLFDGTTFITYEDASSIAEKTAFALSEKLAGVGAWDLSHDKNSVLLGSAYRTLYGK